MRLKQIKLAGFKSFVDPTTVNLPGPRCAVVGPNGCGKSNIIDAVRWVMGESSAKHLRGENLTDVIFNGATTRKPTSQASIELVFDNTDGRIGGEYASYAEISVRRVVTRESQSTYFLNGSRCRRRDILDLFLGTGFGPRSYSIIEQGMISQLVEARPEDLRLYLEEAAGISKYKERRRETENRIRHTRENLARLTDLREELAGQLERLQRQAKAAERYRELKEEERRTTAELHTLRHVTTHARLEQRQQEIAALEVRLEQAAAEMQHFETEIERRRQDHADLSDRFNRVQGRFYQAGADIARIEESIQFGQRRVRQLELDLENVGQRSAEAERQLAEDEQEIALLQARTDELEPVVEAAAEADALAAETLVELEQGYREWQRGWDDLTRQLAQCERDAEVRASRLEHVEQLLQRLRGRQAQLDLDIEQLPEPGESQVDDLADEIAVVDERRQSYEAAIDQCLADLGAAREAVIACERQREQARREEQALQKALAGLDAVQQAALGRDARDSAPWVEANALADAPRLGERLAVAAGWELAVETVLGDYLQGIVVDQLDSFAGVLGDPAGKGVSLLEIGSAAPVAAVRSAIALPLLGELIQARGVALASLVAGVHAADSVAEALAVRHALQPGESVVTRAGVWIGPDWVRVPGDGAGETGIIERAREIELLESRVAAATAEVADLHEQHAGARERVEALEAQREELQRQSNAANGRLAELKTELGVRRVQRQEADARRARLERERDDIDQQMQQETALLEATRPELAAAERAREELAAARDELAGSRQQMESGVDRARQEARLTRDRFHGLNAELRNLESRLAAARTARERLLRQCSELAEESARLEAGLGETGEPLPDLQARLEAQLEARVVVEGELAEVRAALETADHEIRAFEQQRGASQDVLVDVRGRLEGARVERQGLLVEERNLIEQIAATGYRVEDVRAALPADANEAGWREQLEAIDRRIARLGPINLAAIEEFRTQSERKVWLDQQNDDLEQALETLLTAIRKIDRETRQRFKDTFESVNRRLGELFPKVFGGGSAYLELTGEDLLDTGVSLMARPPGKRNASVHLLSGGEKAMTAVALIFAIFQLNPSPVCLLDEVDAPLDDSNTRRFADLIREMSEEVQFVVITHNKITMEMADHLLGVTMHEPGVSRLVSVDVEEAAALAVQ